MKRFPLSVRNRLFSLCFGLVAAFGSSNLLLSYIINGNQQEMRKEEEQFRRSRLIQNADRALTHYRHSDGRVTSARLAKDTAQEAMAQADKDRARARLDAELSNLATFDQESATLINRALAEEPIYADRVIGALARGERPDPAQLAEFQKRLDLMDATLSAAAQRTQALAAEIQRRVQERVALSIRIAAEVTILAGVASVILVLIVVRSIIRPLQITTEAIRKVNAGEFELDLPPISHDEFGDIALALRQFRDHAEKLRRLAYQDPLTGLGNRALLEESLQKAIDRSRQSKERLAVFHMDLDNFRSVNETLGHKVGDRYLCEASARLQRFIPDDALLCRYSGDKFIVLLEGLESGPSLEAQLRDVANVLLRGVAEPYPFGGHLLNMSMSIGIGLFPGDGETVEQLLGSAEAAVYVAKKAGRNNARFAGAQLTSQARRQMALTGDLRRGLELGQFEVFYQPVVDAAGRRVAGAEALLRWHHPERGLLLPGEFVQVAEDAGLIRSLGERCLNAVHAQLRQWNAKGRTLRVAVNLSARQVQDEQILGLLRELLQRDAVAAKLIEFELTESVLFDNSAVTLKVLEDIRKLGFRMGLDDFGTGYSSLSYLQRLPIDKIKIDRQFVAGMSESKQAMAIVSATLALARSLDLEVVAEGVETAQEMDMLLRHDCRLQQGFHFAAAMPAADFERWVTTFENTA